MGSSPAQVTLNVFNLGSLTINIAGATPTATTAEEVVAAINAAVTASALYPVEFRTMARVVTNKVVISAPYVPTINDPLTPHTVCSLAQAAQTTQALPSLAGWATRRVALRRHGCRLVRHLPGWPECLHCRELESSQPLLTGFVMDLNDLPFRVVCCSQHQTASITTDDGAQVNVQQNGASSPF